MLERFFPAKLLVAFADKGSGKVIVEAARLGGSRGGTRFSARSPLEESGDDGGGLTFGQRDAVIILMWDEAESVVASVVDRMAEGPEQRRGVAVMMDAPKAFTRLGFSFGPAPVDKGGSMKSGFMMIVSITNHGEAESLMHVARKAGARGGTIINARGTGTEDDTKYFGISLVPEKEILIILSEAARTDGILEALGSQPLFSEPGGGIIFATEVERFIPLGRVRA